MQLSIAFLCFAVLVSDAFGKIKLTKEEEKKIVSQAEKEAGSAIAKLLQEKIGSKVLEAAREVKGILSKHLGKHIKTTASKILKNAKKKSKNNDDDSAKNIDKVNAFSSEETCTEQCRAKKLASKVKGVQPLLKKLKKMHKGAATSQTVHNTGSRLRKNDAKATHSSEGSEEVENKEESSEQTSQEMLPSGGHQSATTGQASNTEGKETEVELTSASPANTELQGVQSVERVGASQLKPGPHRQYQCPSPCPSICAPTCSQDCCRPMLSLSQFPPAQGVPYYPPAPQVMAPPAPPPTYYAPPPPPPPPPTQDLYVPVVVQPPEMSPPPPPPSPPPAPSSCPPTCYMHCYSICPEGCCGVSKRRNITSAAKKSSLEKKHHHKESKNISEKKIL